MTEDLLHHIWRYSLYHPQPLLTRCGERIAVLSTGEPNYNSGPDFFNALIKTGDIVMAGNVEIHLNASDWYRHGHHLDKAYDNVILQVVLRDDTEVKRTDGTVIPTVEMKFDPGLTEKYVLLLNNRFRIPCQEYIPSVDQDLIDSWLAMLALNRLNERMATMRESFYQNQKNWEQSFYQILARNFGFGLNGIAFEMLSRSLPYNYLLRHRDNLFQLESLLFGQAGMLNADVGDDYYNALVKEFRFLRSKYGLKPVGEHLWRFLRLRPANFPTVRIAQFAALIHRSPGLFAEVIDSKKLKITYGFFKSAASGYWDTHYLFGKSSARKIKSMGVFAVRSVIINSVVPVLYFYGKQRDKEELCRRAIGFLKETPPENNSIVNRWAGIGIRAKDAFQSQALLQLKNEFCSYSRCLECSIGRNIIAAR